MNGFVATDQVLEIDHTIRVEWARTSGMEFGGEGSNEDANVELPLTQTGAVQLFLRYLQLFPHESPRLRTS